METVGKLIYYVDGIRKVSIISNTPFFVGNAEYCNLKITHIEKRGFFRIDRKGSFFTLSNIDESTDKLLVNGEKVKKKTLLTQNSEIIYDNIKFIFVKEKKEVISIYNTNRLQETLRGLQFKLRFNLPFIIILICIVGISMTFFLLYKSYLDELEEVTYRSIIDEDVNSSIKRAENFLKKFPSSKYEETVRKYITDTKNIIEREETLVLNTVKAKDLEKLKELVTTLKSTESKLLLLNILLQNRENLNKTSASDIMGIISTVKDFETIKQSPSVSISYNKIDSKIDSTDNIDKILWLNLKNIYDIYINNRFRQDLEMLRNLERLDTELKCSYLENLLHFYDAERFIKILVKEKTSCTEIKSSDTIKIPKTLFTKNNSSKKIKKYYNNFINALNNFDISTASQHIKVFITLLEKLDINAWKYVKLHKSIQNVIHNNIKFSSTTCYVDLSKVSNPQNAQDIVTICLFLKGINQNKLAINIYKNIHLKKQQRINILSKIFHLDTIEDFKLIKNKLIPLSIYGCETIKEASTLSTLHKALNEIIEITKNKYLNMDNLKHCLTGILSTKVNKFKNMIQKNLESNKHYIELNNVRNLLDKARNSALQKIFDEDFYTYDQAKNDHGSTTQPKIDELVNEVKEIWNNPIEFLEKDIATDTKNLLEICKNIREISSKINIDIDKNNQDSVCFILNHNIGISLKEFVLNDNEKKVRDWNKEVQEYNNKFQNIEDKEKTVLNIINEYRNMMGLQSLKLEQKLIDASKHHAKYLADGGRFGHIEEDEKYKDPMARAKMYGFKGSTVGENIYGTIFGGNESMNITNSFKNSVFEGWYKSSGHHRFLLCKCCKYAGIAKASKKIQSPQQGNKEYWVFVAGCD